MQGGISLVLKLRVASGLVLAVVMIAAILYLPTPWLAAFLLLLCLLAAREWAQLAGIVTRSAWLVYAIAVSGAVAALWVASENSSWLAVAVPIGATVFWILALGVVLTYPRSRIVLLSRPTMVAAGVVALPGAWLALVQTAKAPLGPALLIWLVAAAAAADIGAYFAGRRFGHRKLAPQVSPAKTLEGAIGGAFAILAWGAVGAVYFGAERSLPRWLALVAVLFVASVTGDLFESAFKRARGVKDSGGLLPGHGGVLDRVDSVIATAPVFAVLAPLLLDSY
ncbi:MAG: phosphatidate cytidylyltransferase [Gammaproteobacteria bacterium]|nr:phosphatidate cytidylyltransferase [Gammaproteobacteria bacterium]